MQLLSELRTLWVRIMHFPASSCLASLAVAATTLLYIRCTAVQKRLKILKYCLGGRYMLCYAMLPRTTAVGLLVDSKDAFKQSEVRTWLLCMGSSLCENVLYSWESVFDNLTFSSLP